MAPREGNRYYDSRHYRRDEGGHKHDSSSHKYRGGRYDNYAESTAEEDNNVYDEHTDYRRTRDVSEHGKSPKRVTSAHRHRRKEPRSYNDDYDNNTDDKSASTNYMRVRVQRGPRVDKDPDYMYPYEKLEDKAIAYRGYPIEGTDYLKRSDTWEIQIVSPQCRSPPEPLPQFPQQELLQRRELENGEDEYVGIPPVHLSEQEVSFNSGEAYVDPASGKVPRSEYFFTAGYKRESAVKLQKPFTESIYRYFVAGHSVPVQIVKDQ